MKPDGKEPRASASFKRYAEKDISVGVDFCCVFGYPDYSQLHASLQLTHGISHA